MTSLKVGLAPSIETGLIECIDDTDRNGVFKITDTDQRVTLVQANSAGDHWQSYGLHGLTLEAAE